MPPKTVKSRPQEPVLQSTTNNARPKSRQSTTSIQSTSTQQILPYEPVTDGTYNMHQSTSRRYRPTPEEMLARASHQLINPNGNFAIDPALQSHQSVHHGLPYAEDNAFDIMPDGLVNTAAAQLHPLERRQSQGYESTGLEDTTGDGIKRKKGAASSQANDKELRRLFRENETRSLDEVAQEVMSHDKGPKSEKTKQVFGMLWLAGHCKRHLEETVPRGRVFSEYALSCGSCKVPPLNPASFGKLVRVIFPGIKTRRLGIRGESKYHYVDLSLKVDKRSGDERINPQAAQSIVRGGCDQNKEGGHQRPNFPSRRSQLPADSALFPPTSPIEASNSMPNFQHATASSSLYIHSAADSIPSRLEMIRRPLQFPSSSALEAQEEYPFVIPSIQPYLPPGADTDAVKSLTAVYRSHCLLAIDNFRYCKTEKLADSYKSLVGLLTIPGQKLLAHPSIAAWIQECDWLKYQKMIPLLDKVLLTHLPAKAMAHMENVALGLTVWVRHFFHHQPRHVLDAMIGPATIFVSLLERFLRVNRAALDVVGVLENVEQRDQLWSDWVTHVNPIQVVQQSLGTHGHTRVLNILTQDVRELLSPSMPLNLSGTIFESNGASSILDQHLFSGSGVVSGTTIDRLAQYLAHIPSQFPTADPRSLLQDLDVIGNNISRNFTFNMASSLANWWKIKLFIDEMSYWLAEKGGFLQSGPRSMAPGSKHPRYPIDGLGDEFESLGSLATTGVSTENNIQGAYMSENAQKSGLSNGNNPFNQDIGHADQITEPQHSRAASTTIAASLEHIHDDSGLGIMDDEFGMDGKYGGFIADINGSDPADVVVC